MSDNAARQLTPAELSEFGDLPAAADPVSEAAPASSGEPRHELEAVFDVPVKVQAVLGRSRMDVAQLMRLKAGDVLDLDRRVGEPVDVFVNNRLIARGEIVMIDSALGVTLTEIVRQDR